MGCVAVGVAGCVPVVNRGMPLLVVLGFDGVSVLAVDDAKSSVGIGDACGGGGRVEFGGNSTV